VLRFTCRFGSWKHHTRRLDPPVGLLPSTRGWSMESNGQRRHRPISTIYDFYFQLAKLAAHRPGPRPATACHATQPPHGDGRSSCRHLQTPGRLCQTKVIQKLEHRPRNAPLAFGLFWGHAWYGRAMPRSWQQPTRAQGPRFGGRAEPLVFYFRRGDSPATLPKSSAGERRGSEGLRRGWWFRPRRRAPLGA
jgi:hypothetical protein